MARVCNKFRRTFGPDNFEYFPKTFICPGDRAELLGDVATMISPLPKPYIMRLPSLSPIPDPEPRPVICPGGRVLSFLLSYHIPHLFSSATTYHICFTELPHPPFVLQSYHIPHLFYRTTTSLICFTELPHTSFVLRSYRIPHLFYGGPGTDLFGNPVARRRPPRLSVRPFFVLTVFFPPKLPPSSLPLSLLRQRTSKSAKQKQRRARSPCGLSSPLPAARV